MLLPVRFLRPMLTVHHFHNNIDSAVGRPARSCSTSIPSSRRRRTFALQADAAAAAAVARLLVVVSVGAPALMVSVAAAADAAAAAAVVLPATAATAARVVVVGFVVVVVGVVVLFLMQCRVVLVWNASHSILSCPLPGEFIVFFPIGFVYSGDLRHERIVGIGITQKRANRQQHLRNRQGG